jgi:hypothetical protein
MPENPVIRPVRAGDEIVVQVEGGFVRRPAPADGLVIATAERDVFVTAEDALEALRLLGKVSKPG